MKIPAGGACSFFGFVLFVFLAEIDKLILNLYGNTSDPEKPK